MPETECRLHELTAMLRREGRRLTPQRVVSLRILAANREHPCVDDIYEQVKTRFPTTSLANIYKTLNRLKDMGELPVLGFSNSGDRYGGNRPYPHPHCATVEDLDIPELSELPERVAVVTGYQIYDHRTVFFGTCPRCREADGRGDDQSHSQ